MASAVKELGGFDESTARGLEIDGFFFDVISKDNESHLVARHLSFNPFENTLVVNDGVRIVSGEKKLFARSMSYDFNNNALLVHGDFFFQDGPKKVSGADAVTDIYLDFLAR